jgi:hypothetical protein
MEENLAGVYLDKVLKSDNPGVVLNEFYSRIFGFPYDNRMISAFGMLVKMYGRLNVFSALLDISNMTTVNHTNIVGLITHITRRKFIEVTPYSEDGMMESIKENEKKVKELKKEKLEIRSPFDE